MNFEFQKVKNRKSGFFSKFQFCPRNVPWILVLSEKFSPNLWPVRDLFTEFRLFWDWQRNFHRFVRSSQNFNRYYTNSQRFSEFLPRFFEFLQEAPNFSKKLQISTKKLWIYPKSSEFLHKFLVSKVLFRALTAVSEIHQKHHQNKPTMFRLNDPYQDSASREKASFGFINARNDYEANLLLII